jgi:hypothetical protein
VSRIVILSGVPADDDPWHDFMATSQAIASCLDDAGWTCTVQTTGRSDRAGLTDADLLIVNSGLGSSPGPKADPPAALLDYLASDRPVLGVHAAANTFGAVPAWAQRLGVRWVEGAPMHPPIGWQRLTPAAGPVLAGLDEVTVHPSSSEGIPAFRRGGNPVLSPAARSAAASLRNALPVACAQSGRFWFSM